MVLKSSIERLLLSAIKGYTKIVIFLEFPKMASHYFKVLGNGETMTTSIWLKFINFLIS
jgi:hypothetical protein